jgi:membrane-associated phospholipid phosphatase
MKNVHRWNPWYALPTALLLISGLWLSVQMPYGRELVLMNSLREQPFNLLFKWVTLLGEAWAYVASGIVLMFLRYRYVVLIAAVGLTVIPVSQGLKHWYKVPRPIAYFEQTGQRDGLVLVPGERLNRGKTSFPSGHTSAAYALFTTLAALAVGRWRWLGLPFALIAAVAGISRMFLVQHFLIDVLAGALVGITIAVALQPLNRLLERKGTLEGSLNGPQVRA